MRSIFKNRKDATASMSGNEGAFIALFFRVATTLPHLPRNKMVLRHLCEFCAIQTATQIAACAYESRSHHPVSTLKKGASERRRKSSQRLLENGLHSKMQRTISNHFIWPFNSLRQKLNLQLVWYSYMFHINSSMQI